ncbi:MAG TPA: GNAT family N-acetyltransferase [Lacipirellulaceae bacterium]|jgi:putative acetyltransferase|nr:GNAT family N-acetyltransferase [Lacipirellulaceae bacterium]
MSALTRTLAASDVSAMPTILIRPMRPNDYDAVRTLWESTEGVGLDASDERERIAAYLERNPDLSRVACEEKAGSAERIVGAVLCGFDGRRGDLCHLSVDHTYRGLGIGRRLVEECLAELSGVGMLKCNIRVFANNREGQCFWRHMGFELRDDLAMMQRKV